MLTGESPYTIQWTNDAASTSTTVTASSTVPAGTFDQVIAGETPTSAHVLRSGIVAPSTHGVTSVRGSAMVSGAAVTGTSVTTGGSGGANTGSSRTFPERSPQAATTIVSAAAAAVVRAKRRCPDIRPERSHG